MKPASADTFIPQQRPAGAGRGSEPDGLMPGLVGGGLLLEACISEWRKEQNAAQGLLQEHSEWLHSFQREVAKVAQHQAAPEVAGPSSLSSNGNVGSHQQRTGPLKSAAQPVMLDLDDQQRLIISLVQKG
eukprot:gene11022-11176_t